MEPVACDFIPPETGHYRIDANIVDTKGYPHQSSVLVEAVTITEWALEVGEQSKLGDLKLNCDAQVVKVGDLVRCSVENSLSTAPTLVTIEHNGVIDHWLVRLDPTNPVIEFNIREEYVPNFTLSVLNQNPLDSKNDLDTALARISNTKFKVEHPYYEQLKIAMSSNRESYRVGDQVTLSISAEQGSEVVPIEYTVAVLDETLLNFVSALEDEDNFVDFPVLHELLPAAKDTANRYFDPTKKLWHAIESGVHTLGLLSAFRNQSVVPKTPPETRYQPSFVTRINPLGKYPGLRWNPSDIPDPRLQEVKNWAAYWNPSIISPDGQTKFNFELPNELTRWKVMVAAVSKDHRFGYGTTTLTPKASDIQSNVNIRAVQPNVVTEGDTFQVGASIENRTERKRRFTVELRASGLLATESETRRRRSIEVAPFETKTVSLDVKAIALASNQSRLNDQTEIRVVGSVRGRGIKDELDMRIPVRSSRVRVSKVTYGTLDDSETSVPIEFPRDNTIMDRQIDLTLTSIDKVNLNGVFRTASEEPYSHWEQRLSQAVLAMQYLYLENRGVNHGVLLFEPDGLVTQMLASMPYFQASDGGMVYSRSRYSSSVSPYLSAYSALALSWLDNAGFDVPQETNQKLTAYIQDFLKNESDDEWVDPADEDEELINSLHAITGAVMLRSMALAKNLKEADLAKYSDRIEQMDLFGMSQFLLATLELDSSHSLNDEIMKRIMRHLSSENGTVSILESVPETFAQIHHSNTRTLCSVLEALTKYAQSNSDGIDVGLLTELANSVRIARNGSTRWANSQENVFCTNALITYFDHAESEIRNLYATVDLYIDENQEFIRLADRWEVKKDFTQLHTKHPLQGQRLTPQSILKIIRQGSGTAFYDVEMSYLANLKQEVHRYSGFEIHREYVVSREEGWVILEPGDHINKGDTVLVNIFLNNKFDRYHVVLEDPVPGGLEPVDFEEFWGYRESLFNSTSEFEDILPTSQWYEDFKYDVSRGWVGELGLQKVQFFEDFLRRNKYQAAWIGRAITTGEFSVLPAHVEEMYRPIMYGKSRPWILKVEP